MTPHNSAPEHDASLEEALAYDDADSKDLICFVCGKRTHEQEGQDSALQICQCVYEFYNVFI